MITVPFALYDAFTDTAFGGSQAGVITDAAGIDQDTRVKITHEIGAPATSFVSAYDRHSRRKLPACGRSDLDLIWPQKQILSGPNA